MYLVAYQQFETVPIFSFYMYSCDIPSLFPSYLKLVLLPYVKPRSRLFPVFNKSFAFDRLLIIHERSPPLPAFPAGDVSGKVWSTLITTQQAEIYPKSLLGFAIYLVGLYDVRWHINVPIACKELISRLVTLTMPTH